MFFVLCFPNPTSKNNSHVIEFVVYFTAPSNSARKSTGKDTPVLRTRVKSEQIFKSSEYENELGMIKGVTLNPFN